MGGPLRREGKRTEQEAGEIELRQGDDGKEILLEETKEV